MWINLTMWIDMAEASALPTLADSPLLHSGQIMALAAGRHRYWAGHIYRMLRCRHLQVLFQPPILIEIKLSLNCMFRICLLKVVYQEKLLLLYSKCRLQKV